MQFELTPILLEEIIFAMEDLRHTRLLDTSRAALVPAPEESGHEEGELVCLPDWTSADGYRLMEAFAASPAAESLRPSLLDALARGHGVFRAYKDALSAEPVVLDRWHVFKRRALERRVMLWYNALREQWGLERLGDEPEETDDILLEDFCFVWRSCPPHGELGMAVLEVQDPVGNTAGTISINILSSSCRIAALHVEEAYRGMGLGTALLERALEELPEACRASLEIDVPVSAGFFSRVLERCGFAPVSTRWARSPGSGKGEEIQA